MSEQRGARGRVFHWKPKNPREDELRVWVDPETATGLAAGIGQEATVDQTGPAEPHADSSSGGSSGSSSSKELLYYYDLRTKQVLEGPRGSWQHRLGPYQSPYDAARAIHIARERNMEWEKQNKAWR